MLCDFNVPPGILEDEAALKALNAAVLRPRGGSVSCHQGKGTLIDYAVVSKRVLPIVELALDRDVPWGPHDGLRLRIRKNVRNVMVRKLVKPRPYDQREHDLVTREPWHLPWEEAIEAARKELKDVDLSTNAALQHQRELVKQVGGGEQAAKLSTRLMHWARATEHQALAARGIDPQCWQARKLKGRAMAAEFVEVPLAKRRCDPGAQRLPGGYSDTARLWATMRVLLGRLIRARAAGDAKRDRAARIDLIRCAAGHQEATWRAWIMVPNAADVGAARIAAYRACMPDSTNEDAEAAGALMARMEAEEVAKNRRVASARWHAWVSRALKGGAREAHAWANAPNTFPTEVRAQGVYEPLGIVDYHSRKWAEIWEADNDARTKEALRAVKELREYALKQDGHGKCGQVIDAEYVKKVAERFRRGTAIGTDAQAFYDVAEATCDSRRELASIMRQTIEDIAWPLQALLVVMGLLGKKSGGTRTIAIISTFARLLMAALKGDVRSWDTRVADEHDTALRGRRPADETARRHLWVEAANILGKHAVLVLWDMKAFFDSLDASKLVEAAKLADFPTDQLALGLILHRAPRVLKVQGCFGDIVPSTGRSILPGCTLSTSFARAYLQPLARRCRSDAMGSLWQHVDDLAQCIIAPTRQLAVARAIQKGQLLAMEAQRLALQVAGKSRVVASSPSAAEEVAKGIRNAGAPIVAADRADDLGVSTAAGRRRTTGSLTVRLAKAKRRAQRVQRLTAVNKGASKLYKTGVDPQQSYEGCIVGIAPPQMRAMRRNAALSVAKAGLKPCTASLLAWRLDGDADPAIRTPLRQVQLWMRLWTSTPDSQKAELRTAWKRALPKLLLKGVNWGLVSGPMQSTIACLGQLGWAPVQPDKWVTEDRLQYADLADAAPEAWGQIEQQIRLSAARAVWRGASCHHLGKGLGEGIPSFSAARAARRWMVKHHRAAEAKALDAVVCGGAWCGGREHVRKWCRCGQAETPWHRYYGCERLNEVTGQGGEDIIHRTNWLKDLFDGELLEYQCLWGRAILPWELCREGPEVSVDDAKAATFVTPGFRKLLVTERVAYSDGSGGPSHAPKSAPVAGSGLAVLAWQEGDGGIKLRDLQFAASPVPGRQTVPRAELWAACMAAEQTDGTSAFVLNADAAYVVDAASDMERVERLRRGGNGDLWSRLATANKARGVGVDIRKVQAHAPPNEVLDGSRSFGEYMGNHVADSAAGAAAEAALDRNDAARRVELWERRAFWIARRLAAIEAWHWANDPGQRYAPPEPLGPWTPPVEEAVRDELVERVVVGNGHRLTKMGTRMFCIRCHRRRDRQNHHFWMKTVCRPVANLPPPPAQCRNGINDHGGSGGVSARAAGPAQRGELSPRGREQHGGGSFCNAGTEGNVDIGFNLHLTENHRASVPEQFGEGVYQGFNEIGYGIGGVRALLTEDECVMTAGQASGSNMNYIDTDGPPPHKMRRKSSPEAHREDDEHRTAVDAGSASSGGQLATHGTDEVQRHKKRRIGHLPAEDYLIEEHMNGSAGTGNTNLSHDSDQPMDAFDEPPTLSELRNLDDEMGVTNGDDGVPHHGEQLGDEVRGDGNVEVEDAYTEDPFGHMHGGFDHAQGMTQGNERRMEDQDSGGGEASLANAATDPAGAGTATSHEANASRGARDEAGVVEQVETGLVTARDRRRMVIQQLEEKRKRRRAEMEAVAAAWRGGEAVMGVGDFVDLPGDETALPFAVHATHHIVVCGGYTGCVRCGRVVAFQGHARFATPCRGTCPNGSLRPIRRLIRGEHPHEERRGHLGAQWPSGEAAPTPRRHRPPASS